DGDAVDTGASHPHQTIDDERGTDTASLRVGIDGQALKVPVVTGVSADGVADDAPAPGTRGLCVAGRTEAARGCGGDGFAQRGLVESPHRLERARIDFEDGLPIPAMRGPDAGGDRRSWRK